MHKGTASPKRGWFGQRDSACRTPLALLSAKSTRNSAAEAQIWTSLVVYNKPCFVVSKIPVSWYS